MTGTGSANIDIESVIAGGRYCFEIVYETGDYGIDDSGEIIIARRDVCDSAIPQFEDPNAEGYVSVRTDSKAMVRAKYAPDRYIRPWKSCISITVSDGSLAKGDKVYIRYGMPDGLGMGYRMQRFAEKEHIFRVMADCAGSGNFYDVEAQPVIRIEGGFATELQMVIPSLLKADQTFDVFIRAIDSFGNISERTSGTVIISHGQQETGRVCLKRGTAILENVSADSEGTLMLRCSDERGYLSGKSNPAKIVKDKAGFELFWGDMHGQTKETVGTGTPSEYLGFARDKSLMDFCSWQGNDFQVTEETWRDVCRNIREYNDPGKFVTFLGYEWSGTTPVGGDHNIYYLGDDQPIFRSYSWQTGMESRDGTDRSPISALFQEFAGRDDVMAVPHVGGRYGNIDFYNDQFISLMEIHSHHGTFEWFVEEAIARGLRPGILAASDDHTCRPGLSYPTGKTSRGYVSFDVNGGYTGVYAGGLTREHLWEAFRKRHTYGTTGERILLDVYCGGHIMGDEFDTVSPPVINAEVSGTDEILDVEIKRGLDVIARYSDSLEKSHRRIRLIWSGVRVRSRGKKVNWNGSLTVRNGAVTNLISFAFNQPDEMAYQVSGQEIRWISATSGDIDGIEFDVDWNDTTTIAFSTKQVNFVFPVSALLNGDLTINAGGVNQKVTAGFATIGNKEDVSFEFIDKEIRKGINPYWVKVTQRNGHMAWSSPMYINY